MGNDGDHSERLLVHHIASHRGEHSRPTKLLYRESAWRLVARKSQESIDHQKQPSLGTHECNVALCAQGPLFAYARALIFQIWRAPSSTGPPLRADGDIIRGE